MYLLRIGQFTWISMDYTELLYFNNSLEGHLSPKNMNNKDVM